MFRRFGLRAGSVAELTIGNSVNSVHPVGISGTGVSDPPATANIGGGIVA